MITSISILILMVCGKKRRKKYKNLAQFKTRFKWGDLAK